MRRGTSSIPGQYSLFEPTLPLRKEDDIEQLPATAQYLVEVMSLQATIDLVDAFGGDDLKVPQVVNGESRMWSALVEIIGPSEAKKLVERCGGTSVYVPTCHMALLRHRNRDIVTRYDAGTPLDALRREYKMTRRNLYRVLKMPV